MSKQKIYLIAHSGVLFGANKAKIKVHEETVKKSVISAWNLFKKNKSKIIFCIDLVENAINEKFYVLGYH
ncbi:MAG: hypothetical protein ACTSRI_12945 [Promethearchaeota archaeon]